MLWKQLALALGIVIVVASLALLFWIRSAVGPDGAVATQLGTTIGQPVTIQKIRARLYPRAGVTLEGVTVGAKSEIRVESLDVNADLRPLLSGRIEHATVYLHGAHVELPLPPMTLGSESPSVRFGVRPGSDAGLTPATSTAPVEIVSIDEIVASELEIVSGGRTLRGHIDAVPRGNGVDLRRVVLGAEDMALTATGEITDLAGPVGEIAVQAGGLNLDRLIAYFNDFSGGLGTPASRGSSPAAAPGATRARRLVLDVEAEQATFGRLTIGKMRGRVLASQSLVAIEPLTFALFGGTYDGALQVNVDEEPPTFKWKARVAGIDVAAATAYVGNPDTITGKLDGTIDLWGTGRDAAMAMKTVAGNLNVQIHNGVVRKLGIVRNVISATPPTTVGDAIQQVSTLKTEADEPFTRLSANIVVADGIAATHDFLFDAPDVRLEANGSVRLDGSAIDLKGRVLLSETLSSRVDSRLLRLSQQNGRVTLPATISGTFDFPTVRIDGGDITRRAIKNTVKDAAPNLVKRKLGGLLGK